MKAVSERLHSSSISASAYTSLLCFSFFSRLVAKYRPEMLPETHVALAQQLEASAHFREAESHYCEGGDWKSAVQMYRATNLWEDATRVAKTFGGPNASKQVRSF